MTGDREFPYLERVAARLEIPTYRLLRAFAIEQDFHRSILGEKDANKRKELYRAVYETVHPIYGTRPAAAGMANPKDRIVRLFRRELTGRSILEVGCGNGLFLQSVARLLPHRDLVGLDISAPVLPAHDRGIRFVRGDIIDFTVQERFDVVYSEHVIEHIAPADLPAHIASISCALAEDGILIISAPNGNFGPSDVTRIVDSSHTGKTAAMGTHLHEPTHWELMDLLGKYGFNSFKTIFPFMKLRNYLGFIRFNAEVVSRVERNPLLMRLLHGIRCRGECLARFDTVLICARR
ncbi:MAG TPA: methyltransferase domain-containing protein [Geobacteraceae bacterium]|nr:methyltransferase domain-containing protein [Geobacteraceae bacterium]